MAKKPIKDYRWTLSADPGSNHLGLALYKDGKFYASHTCHALNDRQDYSERLKTISADFHKWIDEILPPEEEINQVITEYLKLNLAMMSVGLVFLHPRVKCKFQTHHMISSSTWKKWAKDHGAKGPTKDIKGLTALADIGFPHIKDVLDEDSADATLFAEYFFTP